MIIFLNIDSNKLFRDWAYVKHHSLKNPYTSVHINGKPAEIATQVNSQATENDIQKYHTLKISHKPHAYKWQKEIKTLPFKLFLQIFNHIQRIIRTIPKYPNVSETSTSIIRNTKTYISFKHTLSGKKTVIF